MSGQRALLWSLLLGVALEACHDRFQVLDAPPDSGASGAPASAGTAGSGVAGAGDSSAGGASGAPGASGAAGEDGGESPDPALGTFIDAGDAHSCATRHGVLYCWGDGDTGQLGNGQDVDTTRPVRVGLDADWLSVWTGYAHTCAVKSDRTLHCFGANDQGQLGQAGIDSSSEPVAVELPEPVAVSNTASSHACAVLTSGALYCWGYNIEGGLGLADTHPGLNQFAPVRVGTFDDWIAVGTGQGHTAAVRADGTLWGWGRNTAAQLGLGDTTDQQRREPTAIGTDSDWKRVVSGQDASCGLKTSGALFCWGGNQFGTLGLGDRDQRLTPTAVAPELEWLDISIDTFHGCGIDTSSTLYCWGRNAEGQLGTGDKEDRLLPEAIGEGYLRVAVGRFHTCAEREPGRFFCTGNNVDGRLGTGDTVSVERFTEVLLPD